MAFTDAELAACTQSIEDRFWSRHRPPLALRNQVREGQRLTGQSIELFLVRAASNRPGEWIEEAIAKVQYVATRNAWQIYWQRADGRWHRYEPFPEADSLDAALRTISEDPLGCFFG